MLFQKRKNDEGAHAKADVPAKEASMFKCPKRGVVEVPIFNTEYKVIIAWSESRDDLCRFIEKFGFDVDMNAIREDLSTSRGYCVHSKGKPPIVALLRPPSSPTYIATLAHEAIHAVGAIMRYIDASDEEVFAHSVAAVVREVLADRGRDIRKKLKALEAKEK